MELHLDEIYKIDLDKLQSDLEADNYRVVALSKHGQLVIDNLNHGLNYPYRREVWQAMNSGAGATNTYWGDFPNGFEFCRSVKLSE